MSECKDIDALMIDRLYGELDESQEAPFDDHVATCARCRAELDSLKATREAMRDLPDEDPPPALSAILLHEAAKRAPAPARARASAIDVEHRPGIFEWLAGLLRPLVQHPAAAAVATLVLVAGVAGSLYLRGAHEVAEPLAITDEEVAGERAPRTETAAAAAPAEQPDVGGRANLASKRGEEGRGYEVQLADEGDSDYWSNADTAQEKSLDDGLVRKADTAFRAANQSPVAVEEAQKRTQRTTAKLRARKSPPPSGSAGSTSNAPLDFTANAVSGADPLVDLEESERYAQPPPETATDDKQVLSQTSSGEVSGGLAGPRFDSNADVPSAGKPQPKKTKGVAKPKPRTKAERRLAKDAPAPARDSVATPVAPNAAPPPAEPSSSSSYRVYRDAKKELEWAKTENRKLSKALTSQRCREAAKIANDILDRNPDFYYKKVAGTKSIKRCQWYVDNEQERRDRKRTKARAQQRRPAKAAEQAAPADAAE